MKYYIRFLSIIFLCLEARNPFFLYRKPIKKQTYVLKGTLIGDIPLACIMHKNTVYNNVCINDKIGECTIIEIMCGTVRIRHPNGQTETLQLEENTKAGENACL